jgi:hypothetical protein
MLSLKLPILIVAWRRPDLLRRSIEALRIVKPQALFVACDGPRASEPGDFVQVAATRQLIDNEIDWPCNVKRLYSPSNHGCRAGVSRAITWFFEHVEHGIILEDDCVPHPDFFFFCSDLLSRYRDDERVWCITGDNFQFGQTRGAASYYFSKYNHVWGWATWRRCWQRYDSAMSFWPSWRKSHSYNSMFSNYNEREYWTTIFDRTYAGEIDTWDYQWTAAVWRAGGLTATPQVNLVTNIGHGLDATHTTADCKRFMIPPQQMAGRLKHPWRVKRNRRADN